LDTLEWIGQKVIVPIRFMHGDVVIAYLDVHTREWAILEFAVKMNIQQIRFFNGNDLVIHTKKRNLHNFHKLSIQ
jgi:hypothetical protein